MQMICGSNDRGGGSSTVPMVAGLLFASHPIHTEAVAGVVGRADILACLFFLLAFLSYISYCDKRNDGGQSNCWEEEGLKTGNGFGKSQARNKRNVTRFFPAAGCLLFTGAAMLSKEQGITVIFVCAVYDVFVHSRGRLKELREIYQVR